MRLHYGTNGVTLYLCQKIVLEPQRKALVATTVVAARWGASGRGPCACSGFPPELSVVSLYARGKRWQADKHLVHDLEEEPCDQNVSAISKYQPSNAPAIWG